MAAMNDLPESSTALIARAKTFVDRSHCPICATEIAPGQSSGDHLATHSHDELADLVKSVCSDLDGLIKLVSGETGGDEPLDQIVI
jgi:hypothetical protein